MGSLPAQAGRPPARALALLLLLLAAVAAMKAAPTTPRPGSRRQAGRKGDDREAPGAVYPGGRRASPVEEVCGSCQGELC